MLDIHNLSVGLSGCQSGVKILDDLNFSLSAGEILGLVGESGSGKSMTALSIMNLLPGGIKVGSGKILFKNQNLLTMAPDQMRRTRGSKISMIFQEPMTALNPVFSIGRQVGEVFITHLGASAARARAMSIAILDRVGIPDAARRVDSYPHQLSGGLRQRVLIAMAMALTPDIILADEPTTALDVTIQAQILSLLEELTRAHRTACLLITHNLAVVAQMADRVAIMYAGRLVEVSPVRQLLDMPWHPYTKGLLACLPARSRPGQVLPTIAGMVPALGSLPANTCPFSPRCVSALARCAQAEPVLHDMGGGRQVACFLYHDNGRW